MKQFLIAGLMLSAPLIAQAPPAPADVSGAWTIHGSVAGVDVLEVCTFTQSTDAKLTGDCDVQGTKWPTTGAVKDADITFQHSGKYNGDDYTITYHGKYDKDKSAFDGNMDVDPFGVSGDFTASRGTTVAAQ